VSQKKLKRVVVVVGISLGDAQDHARKVAYEDGHRWDPNKPPKEYLPVSLYNPRRVEGLRLDDVIFTPSARDATARMDSAAQTIYTLRASAIKSGPLVLDGIDWPPPFGGGG